MAVRDRAHDRADRQAVEIVVDEDEAAEGDGRKLGADAGLDVLRGPLAERGGSAGLVHQADHDAEEDEEEQDTDIVGVGELRDHAVGENVLQRSHEAEVGVEQAAHKNSDEERTVDFLCDEGQRDRDDRRDQCPECCVHVLPPIRKIPLPAAKAFRKQICVLL